MIDPGQRRGDAAPTEATWKRVQAIWDLGEWLARFDPSGFVDVLAPPGVGLSEAPDSDDALRWRQTRWASERDFNIGLRPSSPLLVLQSVADVVSVIPKEWRDWALDCTRDHAAALQSGARLLAESSEPRDHAAIVANLERAMKEYADAELASYDRLSRVPGRRYRERAEIAALVRLIDRRRVGDTDEREVVRAELDLLEPRLDRLLQQHEEHTRRRLSPTLRRLVGACRGSVRKRNAAATQLPPPPAPPPPPVVAPPPVAAPPEPPTPAPPPCPAQGRRRRRPRAPHPRSVPFVALAIGLILGLGLGTGDPRDLESFSPGAAKQVNDPLRPAPVTRAAPPSEDSAPAVRATCTEPCERGGENPGQAPADDRRRPGERRANRREQEKTEVTARGGSRATTAPDEHSVTSSSSRDDDLRQWEATEQQEQPPADSPASPEAREGDPEGMQEEKEQEREYPPPSPAGAG